MSKTWYANTKGNQGIIYEESSGKNIAVSYDTKDAPLIAAAPELLEFAHNILRYVNAGAIKTEDDREFVAEQARRVIDLATASQE